MKYPRILITGGAGFIGSHLSEAFLNRGQKVMVIDDLSTGRIDNIRHLLDREDFKFVVDTVLNKGEMERLIREVDAVYHLASAVGVKRIMEQPVKTVATIVQGSEIALEFCARYHKRVLLTSTSEVYGKSMDLPFKESGDLVLGPSSHHRWAYACAKLLDEFLALAHFKESCLPVTVFRLFNTVGPRQTDQYGMVIPTFIRQALKNAPITVYGEGQQSRSFCHVLDVVRGLVSALEVENARGTVINLGNPEPWSIVDLAQQVIDMTQSTSKIEYIPYEKAYGPGYEDMQRRVPDISRATELLGFVPSKNLKEILEELIQIERG